MKNYTTKDLKALDNTNGYRIFVSTTNSSGSTRVTLCEGDASATSKRDCETVETFEYSSWNAVPESDFLKIKSIIGAQEDEVVKSQKTPVIFSLPELEGSEKQVAWANDIRKDWAVILGWLAADPGAKFGEKDPLKWRAASLLSNYERRVARHYGLDKKDRTGIIQKIAVIAEKTATQTSAKFWIENRENALHPVIEPIIETEIQKKEREAMELLRKRHH